MVLAVDRLGHLQFARELVAVAVAHRGGRRDRIGHSSSHGQRHHLDQVGRPGVFDRIAEAVDQRKGVHVGQQALTLRAELDRVALVSHLQRAQPVARQLKVVGEIERGRACQWGEDHAVGGAVPAMQAQHVVPLAGVEVGGDAHVRLWLIEGTERRAAEHHERVGAD
jgi:hypothetical protein